MEEDNILKSVNYQIDKIIRHCLNKKEITATEWVLLKQDLILIFQCQQDKNEELERKYNEELNEGLKMSEWLVEKQKKIEEQEKMIDLMAEDLTICGIDFVPFGLFTGNFKKDKEIVMKYYKRKASEEK